MGRWISIIGIGTVSLLIVLFAAVLLLPGFIDWSKYKAEIAEQVESRTGRQLTIGGDLSFRIFPQPAMEVEKVALSGPAGDTGTFVTADRIAANLELAPLFSGTVKIRSIVVADATVSLTRSETGQVNWSFASEKTQQQPGVALDTRDEAPAIQQLSIDSFQLEDVAIIYDDRMAGTRLETLIEQAEIGAASLDGPFRLKGTVRLGEETLELQAGVGAFNSLSEAANVTAEVQLNDAARLVFDGSIRNFESGVRVNGRTRLAGENAERAVNHLSRLPAALGQGTAPDAAHLPALGQPFEVEFSLAASQDEVRIRELEGNLSAQQVKGEMTALLKDVPQVDVTLAATGWALDPWIVNGSGTPAEQASAPDDTAPGGSRGIEVPDVTLPGDLELSFDLSAETLRYRERIVPRLALAGRLKEGTLTFKADAKLPAGASFSTNGSLKTPNGKPRAVAQLVADVPNVRGLTPMFDIDMAAVPANRLAMAHVEGRITLDQQQLMIATEKVAIDDLAAALTLKAPLDGSSVALDLKAGRLDISPYMAIANTQPVDKTPLTSPTPKVENKGPLVPVDVDATADIGTFVYDGQLFRDVKSAVRLRGNEIHLDRLSVGDFSGSSLNAKGMVDVASSPMNVNVDARIKAKDLSSLGAGMGQDDISFLASLSPFEGDVSVRSAGQGGELTVKGTAAGSSFDLQASSPDALMAPLTAKGKMALTVRSPSLPALAALGGAALDWPAAGVAQLNVTADGSVAGIDTVVALETPQLTVSANGRVQNLLVDPAANMALDVQSGDVRKLLAALGNDGTTVKPGVKLAVKGDVKGSTSGVRSDDLSIRIGALPLKVKLGVDMAASRPKASVDVTADHIDLSGILGEEQKTAGAKAPANGKATSSGGAARWSKEALPLDILRDWDIALSVKGASLTTEQLAVKEPEFKLQVKDGAGPVDVQAKDVFGGELLGAGKIAVTGKVAPVLDMSVGLDLTGVDLERATAMMADPGKPSPVSGRAELSTTLDAKGDSQAALVNALGGSFRFSARNGVVRGIDLNRLSEQLDYLDDTAAFLKLASIAMNGGETAYRMIETVHLGEKGVFNTAQFASDLDAADLILFNRLDLPAWRLDMDSRMKLRDHPKAPDVGVRLVGALDDPQRIVDTEALQQFIVARILERGVNRVLGIKQQQSAPVEAPVIQSVNPFEEQAAPTVPKTKPTDEATAPAPPAPLSPEDQILDVLLNQMFKGKQ